MELWRRIQPELLKHQHHAVPVIIIEIGQFMRSSRRQGLRRRYSGLITGINKALLDLKLTINARRSTATA